MRMNPKQYLVSEMETVEVRRIHTHTHTGCLKSIEPHENKRERKTSDDIFSSFAEEPLSGVELY